MVFPVHANSVKIWAAGRNSASTDKVIIKDLESVEVSIEGNVDTWSPLDQEGYQRALMTGRRLSVALAGKRNIGDPGNDYLAGLAFAMGEDANTGIDVTFPDGSVVAIPVVANVSSIGTGESLNVAGLEAELVGDGKPTYTPA